MKLSFEEIVDKLVYRFVECIDDNFSKNLNKEEMAGDVLNILISAHISSLFFYMKKIAYDSDIEGAPDTHMINKVDIFIEGMKDYLREFGLQESDYIN